MKSVITTTELVKTSEADTTRQPRSLSEIITSQILLLASYLKPVLEGDDPEAVHKMRVTTRRLQASLDLLQTGEDVPGIRKIKRRLRKWRRVLSEVRNYDVFLLVIEKETTARSKARRQSFEHLKAVLQKRRARRLARARQYLNHINLGVICSRLGLDVELPQIIPIGTKNNEAAQPQTTSDEKQDVSPDAHNPKLFDKSAILQRAADRIEQRLAELMALVAQSHPTKDPAELHQVRIAAKRLRYLLETVSEMGYGNSARALAWLRLLQDRIGDWHDIVALEEEIISIVSSRKFLKEHIAESGRMLQAAAHLQKKKDTLVARLFPMRVPKTHAVTARRLVRQLRKDATT